MASGWRMLVSRSAVFTKRDGKGILWKDSLPINSRGETTVSQTKPRSWTQEQQQAGELASLFEQVGLSWERYKRRYGPLKEWVGECSACDGAVVFRSHFTLLPGKIILGEIPLMKEESSCACRDCGIAYATTFSPFAEKISALRGSE